MKVLVTGCAGYVGSALVPRLLSAKDEVKGIDAVFVGDEGILSFKEEIDFIRGDIRDVSLLPRLVEGMDAVIHLAAISTDPAGKAFARETLEINMEATEALAKAAKAAGVKRFVFASSGSVYHAIPHYKKERMNELDELSPQSAYSLSKLVAEQKLMGLADQTFFPIFLRKATLYGEAPRMRYDLEINAYIRDAFMCGYFTILEGQIRRAFLDIVDACAAYLRVLRAPLRPGFAGAYNVVGMNAVMSELSEKLRDTLRVVSGNPVNVHTKPAGHFRSYWMDGAKMQKIFGITSSSRPFDDAVREVWEGVREKQNPEDARYDNYAQMLQHFS